ncbi:hypothetical protein C8J56DRAFT_923556 [Mycena floridula]|nr:hypothetical protein C8J56DRAFT_923556 [Mycena floridula]
MRRQPPSTVSSWHTRLRPRAILSRKSMDPPFPIILSTTIHIHTSGKLSFCFALPLLTMELGPLVKPYNSSPRYARGYTPTNIRLFLGCDPEVEELVLLLTQDPGDEKRARICILGPGGMAKTELATKVMNHCEIQRCYRLCAGCFRTPSLRHTLYCLGYHSRYS